MRTLAFLLLGFLTAAAPGEERRTDAMWLTRPVPGYRVSLSVEAQPPAAGAGRASHAGDVPHRLRFRIARRSEQGALEVAGLSVYIAEEGYAGDPLPVTRSATAAQPEYEALAVLQPGTAYRVVLRFDPPDGTPAREAIFDYRHHH